MCRRYGKKEKLEELILNRYLGDLPPNTPVDCTINHDATRLLFVALDQHSSLAGYHAMRAALLHVVNLYEAPLLSSRAPQSASTVPIAKTEDVPLRKNLKIPGIFQSEAQIEKDPKGRTRTRDVERSHTSRASQAPKTLRHITIHLDGGGTDLLSHEHLVWQMALAHRKMLFLPLSLSPEKVTLRLEKAHSMPPVTDDSRKKTFNAIVKRNELVRRGILSRQEVNWLLSWVSDAGNLPMQLAATAALTHYIQSDK